MTLCFGRAFYLFFSKLSQKHLVVINQMIYNRDVLMEVDHDNIGYDKRVV